MEGSLELYYEVLLRMDYNSILRLILQTRSNHQIYDLLLKVFKDNSFWYRKLSQEIKTFYDPSVDWLRAYKFLEGGLTTQKMIDAAKNGYLDELELLILNGVDPWSIRYTN